MTLSVEEVMLKKKLVGLRYFCKKCGRNHNKNSQIGGAHKKKEEIYGT